MLTTAYNSVPEQTDDTPFITSIGTSTRVGIVAVSRDLLGGALPYGTELRIVNVHDNPRSCSYTPETHDPIMGATLVVEDTTHYRKRNQVDIWMPQISEAVLWGVCTVDIEVISEGGGR